MSWTFAQEGTGTRNPEKDIVYYSADIITADLLKESALLKGNVRILFEDYELNAKNAEILKKTNTLRAWDEVQIENDHSFIQADEIFLNYKSQQGEIKGVRLTSGQLLLEASRIEKLGPDEYLAKKAKFTTCVTCPPGWRIKGREIKTNIKKYVEIKGGRFQILNQTILPLPHLTLPLNTRRKTGLLNPELENSSNNGLGLAVPFFWAINDHRDLTLSPLIYIDDGTFETTGGKLLSEYNQWLSNRSRLKFESAYMYDDVFRLPDKTSAPRSRWFLEYSNFLVLPRNFIQKTDFTLLKDRQYLSDFPTEVDGWGLAALKNSFSISKRKERSFFSSEIIYFINLLVASTEEKKDNTAIHKLPELSYSYTKTPFLNNRLLFNSNITYTNFQRNGRSFDEVQINTGSPSLEKEISKTTTSTFDSNKDLIRTGHRLRLNAEITAPFQVGKTLDIMPSLNYRDSYYKFDIKKEETINQSPATPYSPYAFSRYLEFATSFKTELSRVYKFRVKHKVIPELILKVGSPINQSENIFFDSQGSLPYHRQSQPITDQDFFDFDHGVQFDYWDRFFRAEVAEFNLTNIFIKKHREGLVTYYDQPLFFKLSQSYDFRNARLATTPDPWSNLNGILKLKTKNYLNHTQASYFYKAQRTNVTTRNTFIYKPGHYFSLEYSDFITVDERGALTSNHTKSIRAELGWELPNLKFSGYANYSILEKKYQGWGTNIVYTPLGNCWGMAVRLWQQFNQPGKLYYHFNLHFNFGSDPSMRKSLLTL